MLVHRWPRPIAEPPPLTQDERALDGWWWPCFACGTQNACIHREPELRLWMRHASAAQIAAAWPGPRPAERIPPQRSASAAQGELFEGARWAL